MPSLLVPACLTWSVPFVSFRLVSFRVAQQCYVLFTKAFLSSLLVSGSLGFMMGIVSVMQASVLQLPPATG